MPQPTEVDNCPLPWELYLWKGEEWVVEVPIVDFIIEVKYVKYISCMYLLRH